MIRKLFSLSALVLVLSVSAKAQDRVEVFGGYSFMHYGTSPSFNSNGWDIAGEYKLIPWLGVFGDVDGHYGSVEGVGTTEHNFLVGPQVSFPAKISPFAHVMIGGGHFSGGGVTSTSFAEGGGFGVDDHLMPFISWRIIQLDIIHTHLLNNGQNSTRVETGIVFHF